MQPAQSASAWTIATLTVTALGLGYLILTLDTQRQHSLGGGTGSENPPAAVLAWAKLNCDPSIEIGAAPVFSAEELMNTVANYDSAAKTRNLHAVCQEALTVTAMLRGTLRPDAGEAPEGRGELLAARAEDWRN